jgi:hypothetical protein
VSVRVVRLLIGLAALVAGIALPQAGAGAQDLPVYAPQVESALELLDVTPSTHQVRGVLATNQVDVHFVPMAPGIFARYSLARHVIEVDERWADSEPITLAAVIAHEATHAQDAVSGFLASGGASACIDSEIRAFRNSALFWIAEYGPALKSAPASDLDRQLNSIADRQLHDPQGLESLVRETYSQQCAN